MSLPDRVRAYLDHRQASYQTLPHPPGETLPQLASRLEIPLRSLARAVLLQDAVGLIMAVLPGSHILDFSILCRLAQRDLQPLYGAETAHFFQQHGCVANSYPPLPDAFGLSALADYSFSQMGDGHVYFDGGSGDLLIRMRLADFRTLLATARWEQFAVPLDYLDTLLSQQEATPAHLISFANRYTPAQLRHGIETIADLPEMPASARQIMALRAAAPEQALTEVLHIAGRDPILAAQLVYWARSSLRGAPPVDSLEAAVQTLGLENALNFLLASTMSQGFQIPSDGPVGLHNFWRRSIYCTALVGELVKRLPPSVPVNPGLAYLSGLLHNFGYLALGHLFPARFFLVNRFLAVNPHVPLDVVDRYVLGTEHWQIGAWLMQAWEMPEEVIAAVRWHHNEDCTQPYAEYSNLVLIANRLLQRIGLGEDHNHRLPTLALFTLGLSHDQAADALERVCASAAELDALSQVLGLPSVKE